MLPKIGERFKFKTVLDSKPIDTTIIIKFIDKDIHWYSEEINGIDACTEVSNFDKWIELGIVRSLDVVGYKNL